ncbi:MAG: Mov34/MPN/PAD-1 family protein [Promethearchaeota archaeon]
MSIKKFLIPHILIDVIKKQARSSYDEIYGWLIGYSKNDIPHILAISECKRFEQQTLISAIPHALEFQELSSTMPQGIGPIGIYHSHPASSRLFHSHTDDNTLISLTNQFENCVSIVTNGEEINFYQMGKEKKTREIKVEFEESEVIDFILVAVDDKFDVRVSNSLLKDLNKTNYIKMKIQNILIDSFQKHWKEFTLSKNDLNINEKVKVNEFSTNDITAEPIYIKIPQVTKEIISNLLILKDRDENNGIIEENEYTKLDLSIKTKFLIYIIDHNRELYDFKNVIRVEFLGNIIPQKFASSVLDLQSCKLGIPEDYFLNYFGFFIRILSFKDKKLNNLTVSKSNYEFLSKLISSINSFTENKMSKKLQIYLAKFLSDLEIFSIHYDWGDEIKKSINLLRINLNLNMI